MPFNPPARAAVAALALPFVLAACPRTPEPPASGGAACLNITDVAFQSPDGVTPATATYPIPSIRATFDQPLDISTINNENVRILAADGSSVPASTNGANFPNSVEITPRRTLQTDAAYTVEFTSGLKTPDGCALATTQRTFTVRHAPVPAGTYQQFTLNLPVRNPTAMAFGPDGRLYVAELQGTIHAVTLATNADGTKRAASVQDIHALDGRAVTGIALRATAENGVELWASNADLNEAPGATNPSTDPYGSRVTRLTGADFTAKLDAITGIPRSAELHQVNGIAFGATDALYIDVGGMTNYGAPSEAFGNRPEKLMSSAVLVADLGRVLARGSSSVNVRPTSEGGTYPIDASDPLVTQGGTTDALPVKVFASGLRNPYGLVYTSSGALYSTDNGGNPGYGTTPGDADGCPGYTESMPGVTPDKVNLVRAGAWYGFPNPARGECALNESQSSPVTRAYAAPALEVGDDTSTDGLAEYAAATIPGTGVRNGDLLFVNYASTKALGYYRPSDGSHGVIAQPFDNPLAVAVEPDDGTIYVGEFGNNPVSPYEGNPKVSYLVPKH